MLGLGLSLLCLVIFGAENFIIPAMLMILAVLILLRGKIEEQETGEMPAGADREEQG